MHIPQDELITVLSDGRFHSGSELGVKWGVSRTAVSNAIRKLELPGLEVFKVRGKGYRLSSPLCLLDRAAILNGLSDNERNQLLSLEIFNSIASTNSYLLKQGLPVSDEGALLFRVCMSEMQHAGRGSRGRAWVSPFGHNIYLSISSGLPGGMKVMDGLSLVCGLAVLKTLRLFGIERLGLKWPNDVLIDDKKVAGILVEVNGELSGNFQVVIGIGINLKMPSGLMGGVEQPWSCLEERGFRPDLRNSLAGGLIREVMQTFVQFAEHGLSHFGHELAKCDVTLGREIVLVSQTRTFEGRGAGIASDGSLRISTPEGVLAFRSGQVSLRLGSRNDS